MNRYALFIAFLFFAITTNAQKTDTAKSTSSTDSLMNSLTGKPAAEPVIATFKSTRLILSQTTETVKKGNLNFLVVHRFGDIGGSAGGSPTLWGFDNSSDIYIGFEYGLTNNLDIDFGRSKLEQLLDLQLKYAILRQKSDESVPVAITLIGKTGLKPYVVTTNVFDTYTNRLSYLAQAVIARKFSPQFSLQVTPTFLRTNLPFPYLPGNEQQLFAMGVAGRIKVTKRMGIVFDYQHPFSNFRQNSTNPVFYDPLAFGIEIETGGHVFTINFTNAQAINEINYLSDTESSWTKGQFRLGFTISRIFDLNSKHKGTFNK